jgi:multisubunit Na+/H+ antiporter MnhG subunit
MNQTMTKMMLFLVAGFVLLTSYQYPSILLENNFLSEFISHEVLNALIVMVTITLPVGFTLIEKARLNKKQILKENISDEYKARINQKYDEAIERIKTGAKYMVGFLMVSLLFMFLEDTVVFSDHDSATSFLRGAVFYMFIHSIVVMVEMYMAMYNWWSPEHD